MTGDVLKERRVCKKGAASIGAPHLIPSIRGRQSTWATCSFSPYSSALLEGGFPLLPPPPDPFSGLRPTRGSTGIIRSESSQPLECLRQVPDPGRTLMLFTYQILPILRGHLEAHLLWASFLNLHSPSPQCFFLSCPPTSSSNPETGFEEHHPRRAGLE